MAAIRLYYNLRSPYSWLGARRVAREALPVELVPLLAMPSELPNAPPSFHALKLDYIVEDSKRLARYEGLRLRMPQPFDVNWLKPHAAVEWARSQEPGREVAFASIMGEMRFCENAKLDEAEAVGEAARRAGLEAQAAVAAMTDRGWHERALGWKDAIEADKPFGVPFFVVREGESVRRYFGQDRIDALLRDLG